MICFELLMLDGSKATCCHMNYKKSEHPTSAFSRAKDWCAKFDFDLPNSAYGWTEARTYLVNTDKIKEEINNRHFAKQLYPTEQIAEAHLKIQRIV